MRNSWVSVGRRVLCFHIYKFRVTQEICIILELMLRRLDVRLYITIFRVLTQCLTFEKGQGGGTSTFE